MAKQIYPLQSLLNVRYYREDNAKKDLNTAKREKQEAEEFVIKCEKKLEEYIAWRLAEEDRRYDEILGNVCTMEELEKMKQSIADLKIKEISLEEDIEKAKQVVIRKEEAIQNAKEALLNAQKETSKILAHQDIWKELVKKEEARLEDVEMEDFKPKVMDEIEEI